jgi:anthranilate phosphoribosyltransferase
VYHSLYMKKTDPLLSAICTLRGGQSLSSASIADAFRVIMTGQASDGLIGAFLGILATRVPSGEELYGASVVMKECVRRVDLPNPETLLDTCGTGGAPKTFNVSTAASIVSAACGVRVAKHGNRSQTGRGSAEVLEQLGINIETTIEQQVFCLNTIGICFCFAPKHHKAVAHVVPVRKALGFPTIFNILGPLTNPCSAGRQLLGVWDDALVLPVAESLLASGTVKSAVVHSQDGLDEISISAPTRVVYIENGCISEKIVSPESVGLRTWSREEVTAQNLETATEMIRGALIEGREGAVRDMILLSVSHALYLADQVGGLSEGVEMGAHAIDSGKVSTLLIEWAEASHVHTPSTETK